MSSLSIGKRGELQARDLIFAELGVMLKRDLDQYRSNDRGDLIPASDDTNWCFVVEVKIRKDGWTHDKAWWEQVTRAANAQKKIPVLMYKFKRRDWRFVIKLNTLNDALSGEHSHNDDYLVTLDADTFFYIAREILSGRER